MRLPVRDHSRHPSVEGFILSFGDKLSIDNNDKNGNFLVANILPLN